MWFEIDMAPRDGTVVLVCSCSPEAREWTNSNLWAAPKAASWRTHRSGDCVAPPAWRDARGSACRPTHFAALPAPPEFACLEHPAAFAHPAVRC